MNPTQQKIFRAIATYIPQFVVEERVQDPGLPYVRGQFRQGTLVFSDVSGFTAMSEKLSELGKEGAEELTAVLNGYFTHMLNIASGYGGIQLKFGGDALLLFFMGERHAVRAARCALRMQQAMKKFRKIPTSQGSFRLEMSIALNSGDFFEASVGAQSKRLFCIFSGREVNRTARIESVANATEIFMGPGTFRELGRGVRECEEREGCYGLKDLRARVPGSAPSELDREDLHSESVIEILSSYLPRPLAERLKNNPEQAGFEGEHRRVAVMFVNLLGSTEIIEERGKGREEEITCLLSQYYQMVEEVVDKYGGVVVGCDLDTKGDKVLIVFGAPVAHENDDERAIFCALELRQRLADLRLPLRQRIGINTGNVFSGEVGPLWRREYTVMGDEVNLAARLMGVAREGEILASHATYARVANRFLVQAREPMRVKGKSQAVAAYSVEAAREETGVHRQLSSGRLVGREKEMGVVGGVVERTLSGKGQVLAVSGPSGIGKSRLVEELKLIWKGRADSVLGGDCQSFGANITYLPWIEFLGSFFELRESDSAQQRAAKIVATVADLCPGLAEWTAIMGDLLHVPIPESALLKSLDPKLRHQRLMDVTLELLLARAQKSPLLCVFEDLHWIDSASLELLNYVARNIKGYPILVCLVYRSGGSPRFEAEKQDNYTAVCLQELSPESSLDLLRAVTNMKELPQELCRIVVSKSQGNPFFVEEVVKSLFIGGYLKVDAATGECQVARDLSRADIPDTIQGVIMARLDQLEDEPKNVLRVASAIGRHFQYEVVRDIYPRPIPDPELQRNLDVLVELGLVLPEAQRATPEYYFKQVLTQEVAYESLLFTQRRELHRKVGEYFEKHYAPDLEEHFELLAYHYGRTKDGRKALDYTVKAGDKAKRMFANEEAFGYYQRALDMAAGLPGGYGPLSSRVRENLGDVCELSGRYVLALETYQASQHWYETARQKRSQLRPAGESANISNLIIDVPSREDRRRQVAILCRKIGVVYERRGEYEVALGCFQKGLGILTSGSGERARLCSATAGVLYRRGEHALAVEWCRRGLETARTAADFQEVAHCYYLLGTILTDMGNIEQAIEYRQQSLKIFQENKDLLGQARVHNNLGVDYYYLGNWEKCREHYGRSLELREKIGDVNGVATVSNNLGEVLSDQGHLDEAVGAFLRCLKTWERTGYSLGIGLSHSNLGKAYSRQRKWQEATAHLEESLQIFERLQSKGFLAEVYQRLAEAYLGSGKAEEALKFGERSLAIALEREMKVVEGVTRRIMGQVYRSLNKLHEAEESFLGSQGILQKLNVPYELGQTLMQLALLYGVMEEKGYVGEGTWPKIRPLANEAVSIFERLGVEYDSEKVSGLSGRF